GARDPAHRAGDGGVDADRVGERDRRDGSPPPLRPRRAGEADRSGSASFAALAVASTVGPGAQHLGDALSSEAGRTTRVIAEHAGRDAVAGRGKRERTVDVRQPAARVPALVDAAEDHGPAAGTDDVSAR